MQYGRRPEAIDTRWVFRVYAVAACLGGLIIASWGPMWFGVHLPDQPSANAALVRILGVTIIAAGFCAAGFGAVDDPAARRRGLFWFAVAHTVVGLMTLQEIAILDSPAMERTIQGLGVVTFVLFYLWGTSEGDYTRATVVSLFSGGSTDSERLRSHYEEQLRSAARQEERTRLARDLHDAIKQQIFVVQTAAATVQARLGNDPAGAREAAERVRTAAREAMSEMEAMLDQLRAAPLGNAGLVEALKKHCEALESRTGAQVQFRLGELPPNETFPPGAHEAILRVAQEALANIGRHARARQVLVSLGSGAGEVELKVRDDGAGFDTNDSRRGQGIANMHARAAEFGGTFDLSSLPGKGTSIVFRLPYATGETAGEYRQRAILSAVLLLVSILFLTWLRSAVLAAMTVVTAIAVARYAIACRRAQAAGR